MAQAANETITLPKGGGAIQGLGETFSPDLFTGTGNFSVPIEVPPGRNGFQPNLTLGYSTGQGNGPFGWGWALSIPGVTRKTSQGIPRYQGEDTFILSGAEDLVALEKQDGRTCYRPRTEGLFARIYRYQNPTEDYWSVHSIDGLVSTYGTPSAQATNSATIRNPREPSNVFAWRLSKTQDPFGNQIVYEYERDAGEIPRRPQSDQVYLQRIRYADYGNPNNPQFLVSVTFHYEDRPDPFSEHRAGFELFTRKRCTAIEIRTHADVERLVKRYTLLYVDQREQWKDEIPLNGSSLLKQIIVTGYDEEHTQIDQQSETLPPLEFSYTQFSPDQRNFIPLEGSFPASSLNDPNIDLVDLFGNGLPDIVDMNGGMRYWRNLGNGRFDRPRLIRDAPAGVAVANSGTQFVDANGDGRTDLLVTQQGLSGYFPLQFHGVWDRRSFQAYDRAPSFDLKDPEVRLLDLTGDGVTDAVRSGKRFECYFNDPQAGWNETRWVERRGLDQFPNVNFSDSRVKWGDMSGDGLQDIMLVYDGNVEYWPNLGYGDWGTRISMRNSPRFPSGYDPAHILVGDVDGDGLADLIYVDHCKVLLWINQSGQAWSDPIEIKGTPGLTGFDDVRLIDLLGTGVPGLLWSTDASRRIPHQAFFLDFTGGVKPYLLNEMTNHMGAITRTEYVSSTRYYLDDEQNQESAWQTPLPFPTQVVRRVEVIDEISNGKLSTEYQYHHGYWDGHEREFRGFGRVDQRDTETFTAYHQQGLHGDQGFEAVQPDRFSPPIETRSWFHQGPIKTDEGEWITSDFTQEFWVGDANQLVSFSNLEKVLRQYQGQDRRDALRTLRGRVLRSEIYARDNMNRQDRPFTVNEDVYTVREEEPEEQGLRPKIFFPHILAARTTHWERGEDPKTAFTLTRDYDMFGQPRQSIHVACPRGWRDVQISRTQEYLVTVGETHFAQRDDTDVYIVNRPASTRSYEIRPNQALTVAELISGVVERTIPLQLIGHTLQYYDGDQYEGLPNGHIGEFGALVRSEALVLTEEILHAAYKSGEAVLAQPEIPPYLDPDGAPVWSSEYPQAFQDNLSDVAGYIFYDGDTEHERGYYATGSRQRYDFHETTSQTRGLPITSRDPFDNETTITYDTYSLLPVRVIDPLGLTQEADFSYRTFQPWEVRDTHQNIQRFAYSPLGFPIATWVVGQHGEGDSPDKPSTRFEYDFLAFINSSPDNRQPTWVRTRKRVHHAHDTHVPAEHIDDIIESVEYSDGFGRVIQTRAQAEDKQFGSGPFGELDLSLTVIEGTIKSNPVVVSGWTTYNNKGKPVEQYEPFYQEGWDYFSRAEAQTLREEDGPNLFGHKASLHYDSRGRVVRTVNPNGSEQRVIYGIPLDVTRPDEFAPSPWVAYTYEANDNAGRTHPTESEAYQEHWNTPSSIEIDALGRTVKATVRNGHDPATEWYTTQSTYDIRGNVLTVVDALGRESFRYTYDLANRPLRIESLDAGIRRIVLNVSGNELERRDSKGAVLLAVYDRVQRLKERWARDHASATLTQREHLTYGDEGDRAANAQRNLLGAIHQHYDEAGLVTINAVDFKGNPLEKRRQVFSDAELLQVYATLPGGIESYQVNWDPPSGATREEHAGSLLNPIRYETSLTYDALNRVTTLRYPEDQDGERKILRPTYNRAGALQAVTLVDQPYVEHIAYNAKGQRVFIAYGNGVITRYAYEPETSRLSHMRTQRATTAGESWNVQAGTRLQEMRYTYDLVGNILTILDQVPGCGVRNNPQAAQAADAALRAQIAAGDALVRQFSYDPLSRLTSATGRECRDIAAPRPWSDTPRCGYGSGNHGTPNQDNAPALTTTYTETYTYDPAGNMLNLRHASGQNGWVRHFGMAGRRPNEWATEWPSHNHTSSWTNPPGNATTHVGDDDPATPQTHTYDANGNLVRETSTRHFEWNHSDQLKAFRTQAGNAEPSVHAQYLYDASGQRVFKLLRRQGGNYDVCLYIDGIFEHVRWNQTQANAATNQHSLLHIMDDQQRIALARVGPAHPDDGTRTTPIKYVLGDHLGSSSLVVSSTGTWINREEYFPYGETSLGSYAKKQYRFTGKERDEESGCYYHGHRFYSPQLTKWLCPDPAGSMDGLNLYWYSRNNPITFLDQHGLQTEQAGESSNNDRETLNEAMIASFLIAVNPMAGGTYIAARLFDLTGSYTVNLRAHYGPVHSNIAVGFYTINEGIGGIYRTSTRRGLGTPGLSLTGQATLIDGGLEELKSTPLMAGGRVGLPNGMTVGASALGETPGNSIGGTLEFGLGTPLNSEVTLPGGISNPGAPVTSNVHTTRTIGQILDRIRYHGRGRPPVESRSSQGSSSNLVSQVPVVVETPSPAAAQALQPETDSVEQPTSAPVAELPPPVDPAERTRHFWGTSSPDPAPDTPGPWRNPQGPWRDPAASGY